MRTIGAMRPQFQLSDETDKSSHAKYAYEWDTEKVPHHRPGPRSWLFFALGQQKVTQESCGIQDGHLQGSINKPRRYAIGGTTGTAEIETTSQLSDYEL